MSSVELIKSARDSWPKLIGLLLAYLAVVASGSLFSTFLPKFLIGWFIVAGLVAVTFIWLFSRRLKRCPEGKFGFVIAISVDNEETYKIFERDFSQNLEALLRSGNLSETIWVYHVPQFYLQKNLSQDEANILRKITKSGFILYGQVRTRTEDVKKHYLDLNGFVAHAETLDANKQRLSYEFSELLPRRSIAPEGAELPSFELTSSLSSIAAKYIVGIAAYLSGFLDYADAMYADAEILAKPISSKFEIAKKVIERIPTRRTELAITRARILYKSWSDSRSEHDLKEMGKVLAAAPEEAHKNSQWKTLQAISLVANAEDDFDKFESLVKAGDRNDPVTEVNLAFFDVVKGDLRAATRHYKNAADLNVTMETIDEIMSFLEWFHDYRPKYFAQVNFALGYISYYLLRDIALAEEFFGKFRKSRGTFYERENNLIDGWIDQLARK